MASQPRKDPKEEALKRHGALNPRPEGVRDPQFTGDEFFDPRDLVQVRYEMVRRVEVEGEPVSETVRAFGCSRPTFYKAKEALGSQGLSGLLPKKRGPRGGHKMKGEVLSAVLSAKEEDPSLSPEDLAEMVLSRFGVSVHPRTVRRALSRRKKKRP
jgi:transposase